MMSGREAPAFNPSPPARVEQEARRNIIRAMRLELNRLNTGERQRNDNPAFWSLLGVKMEIDRYPFRAVKGLSPIVSRRSCSFLARALGSGLTKYGNGQLVAPRLSEPSRLSLISVWRDLSPPSAFGRRSWQFLPRASNRGLVRQGLRGCSADK
jgi:hypothetical protein